MLSIVIPFYNEELLIQQMLERVICATQNIGTTIEVVCVNDGSADSTLEKLLNFQQSSSEKIRIVSLSRNFGLQAAITAGLSHATGDHIVLIDGDLQDPPELIPEMFTKLHKEGLDIVIGKRRERNERFPKKQAIQLFHKLFGKISGLDDVVNTGNFSIMTKEVVNNILKIEERTRYTPGLRAFVGFKRDFYIYDRPDRLAGEAKMTTKRLLELASDAVFSFSKLPIKLCLYLGLMGIFLLIVAGFYSILSKAMGLAPLGWSSTILSIYFIGTIQLTFLGVIGEYVYRIYKEVQKRPVFIVNEVIDKDGSINNTKEFKEEMTSTEVS